MKIKALFFIIFTVTLFALGVLITTLFNTGPVTKDAVILFYASLFLVAFGTLFFTLLLVIYQRTGVIPGRTMSVAVIRGVLVFDFLIVALLALKAEDILTWPNALVLALATSISTVLLRRRVER